MYEDINIYVADVDTGEIYGATDETKIGKRLDDIGMVKKELVDGMVRTSVLYVDGEKCNCIFKQSGDYVVGVTFAAATNNASNFTAMLILAVYLGIASAFIMFMVFRVLKANREKQEQFAILASMSEIYYSMHLINLEDNSVLRYSGQEEKSSQIYYKNAPGTDGKGGKQCRNRSIPKKGGTLHRSFHHSTANGRKKDYFRRICRAGSGMVSCFFYHYFGR